ncbi:MAG: OmpA family protein [Bacteroidetes bacterium]|nr:OmpA family protein [Bacteroidota bacterium]
MSAVTIHFSFNASALDKAATQSLDSIVQQAQTFSDYTIYVSGHTDDIGSSKYNEELSQKRAVAVRNYLIAHKIDSTKIKYDSFGERKPAVPNSSDANRALNRRVEITISGQKTGTTYTESTVPAPEQKIDSIVSQDPTKIAVLPAKKEFTKKKSKRRLVWTGWKTGFHWTTAGKKERR